MALRPPYHSLALDDISIRRHAATSARAAAGRMADDARRH